MENIKHKLESLNQLGKKVPQIVLLSEKTGVEPMYIIAGSLFLSALIILITMGGTILTVVLTVVYPAYKSIKALETKDNEEDGDGKGESDIEDDIDNEEVLQLLEDAGTSLTPSGSISVGHRILRLRHTDRNNSR